MLTVKMKLRQWLIFPTFISNSNSNSEFLAKGTEFTHAKYLLSFLGILWIPSLGGVNTMAKSMGMRTYIHTHTPFTFPEQESLVDSENTTDFPFLSEKATLSSHSQSLTLTTLVKTISAIPCPKESNRSL